MLSESHVPCTPSSPLINSGRCKVPALTSSFNSLVKEVSKPILKQEQSVKFHQELIVSKASLTC